MDKHIQLAFAGLMGRLFVASLAPVWAQQTDTLMSRARVAIGGSRLQAVKALTFSGSLSRAGGMHSTAASGAVVPEEGPVSSGMKLADLSGQFSVSILLPDRIRWEETPHLPGGVPAFVRVTCLDGDSLWRESHRAAPLPDGVSVKIVPPEPTADADRKAANFRMARYLLALLLDTGSKLPIRLTYAGKTVAADGEVDVLNGNAPDGVEVRLFLNRQTGLPMMLDYPADPEGPGAKSGAREQLQVSDYREVDGLMLPHRFTIAIGTTVKEQLQVERYRVNPNVSLSDFGK